MNAQENMLGWLRATLKPEFDELAEKIDVQADIVGQLGASFHALASRVAALEGQGNRVGGTVPESSAVTSASPAPPAPLVERMIEAWRANRHSVDIGMRAALLVAAEELLGDVTLNESMGIASHHRGASAGANAVLRARLARAKEAARG